MNQQGKSKSQLKKEIVRAYEKIVARENERNHADKDVAQRWNGQKKTAREAHRRKMEAVSQVTGSLAQYFNNFLTLVIGYGSLVHARLGEGDPLRPYVHQILASSERAALLTRSLLAFSRKQVMNARPVSLNRIIRQAGRMMQRVVGDGIEFRTRLSTTDVPIAGDPVQLEQVMMNLATNARDAMPNGGTLTVETKLIETADSFSGNEGGAWRCAVISFSDTGTGMDEKTRERMFDPFYTTKEPAKATGLGLAIVQGIIKQHNGSIHVTSHVGKGTKLSIYLPVIPSAIERNEQLPAAMG